MFKHCVICLVISFLTFYSTVSSSINALVAVTVEDFVLPMRKNLTEKQVTWMNMGLSKYKNFSKCCTKRIYCDHRGHCTDHHIIRPHLIAASLVNYNSWVFASVSGSSTDHVARAMTEQYWWMYIYKGLWECLNDMFIDSVNIVNVKWMLCICCFLGSYLHSSIFSSLYTYANSLRYALVPSQRLWFGPWNEYNELQMDGSSAYVGYFFVFLSGLIKNVDSSSLLCSSGYFILPLQWQSTKMVHIQH